MLGLQLLSQSTAPATVAILTVAALVAIALKTKELQLLLQLFGQITDMGRNAQLLVGLPNLNFVASGIRVFPLEFAVNLVVFCYFIK